MLDETQRVDELHLPSKLESLVYHEKQETSHCVEQHVWVSERRAHRFVGEAEGGARRNLRDRRL